MSKELLINVSEGEECRIALVEDGKLDELYMERTSATSHVGNIYKGRVTNVEASIQAAFIDFGMGRNGFLHISDLLPTYFGRKGEDVDERVGMKMARRDRPPIQRCLRRGDEIIVQVIKEGIGTKGPTLTSYLSISGKLLVMMPGMMGRGVSRKIEDEDERRKLRHILEQLNPPDDCGFIIRTEAVGKTKTEIERDLKYLARLWETMKKKRDGTSGPTELYTEGDLVTRTVRDVFTADVDRLIVDSEDVANRVREVVKLSTPRAKDRVELYEGPLPLFHKYGVEREIELMYSRHVPLRSGGSLVIDSTEAIVAIDVNSGKFRDHSDAEMTAFKTDMEAADEICRQLKLRDLGGVIICDFIDLRYERHRRDLEKRLHDNLKNDRAKTKVLRMSEFGIIEMTRQRMRASFKRSVYFDCPHCKGAGLVKTPESMSLDVMRRMAIAINDLKVARVELTINPEVNYYLQNKKRRQLADLEDKYDKNVIVRAEPNMGLDEMRLELFDARDGLVVLPELEQALAQPRHVTQLGTKPQALLPAGRGAPGGGGAAGGRGDDRRRDGGGRPRQQPQGRGDDRGRDRDRGRGRDRGRTGGGGGERTPDDSALEERFDRAGAAEGGEQDRPQPDQPEQRDQRDERDRQPQPQQRDRHDQRPEQGQRDPRDRWGGRGRDEGRDRGPGDASRPPPPPRQSATGAGQAAERGQRGPGAAPDDNGSPVDAGAGMAAGEAGEGGEGGGRRRRRRRRGRRGRGGRGQDEGQGMPREGAFQGAEGADHAGGGEAGAGGEASDRADDRPDDREEPYDHVERAEGREAGGGGDDDRNDFEQDRDHEEARDAAASGADDAAGRPAAEERRDAESYVEEDVIEADARGRILSETVETTAYRPDEPEREDDEEAPGAAAPAAERPADEAEPKGPARRRGRGGRGRRGGAKAEPAAGEAAPASAEVAGPPGAKSPGRRGGRGTGRRRKGGAAQEPAGEGPTPEPSTGGRKSAKADKAAATPAGETSEEGGGGGSRRRRGGRGRGGKPTRIPPAGGETNGGVTGGDKPAVEREPPSRPSGGGGRSSGQARVAEPTPTPTPPRRSGSADKHLMRDEPLPHQEPPRRPKSSRDLDDIPYDLD